MKRIGALLATFLAIMGITISRGMAPSFGADVKPPAKPDAKAPKDSPGPFMGEYEGTFTPAGGASTQAIAKVCGLSGEAYKVVVILPAGKDSPKETRYELTGKPEGEEKLVISGKAGEGEWTGTLAKQQLLVEGKGGKFDLKFLVRKPPTEGKKPPQGAVVLLPFEEGKETNLDAWANKKWKLLPDGSIQAGGGDTRTVKFFGDFELHAEFMIPYEPGAAGQGRGNSGVYLQDRYEIQVLDSFGLVPKAGDCGAIYTQTAPKAEACLPPLRWQTYDITFRAPRLDEAGKVTKDAVITVVHNGVKVHDNASAKPTGAAKSMPPVKEAPLRLQDHGHPVRFRNIWLVELKGE